jgi:tRNA1Val (adenine37-N6)-methyltransferase
MPNSYFKFKQFTIHQEKCAMKVCTDACLFGALVANSIFSITQTKGTLLCLDIGTGTGLLSLMTAQKSSEIKIDAIEIDAPAALQASENIAATPWKNNIQVYHEDIISFVPGKQYDCIFSNPPFFEDDLQSGDEAKNNARHNVALTLLQLLQVVDRYVTIDGFFAVLLPYHRLDYFKDASKRTGLYLNRQILVKQTIKHKFFRAILFFSRKETEIQFSEIIIKDPAHNYTPGFSAALQDYYLFL